MYTSLNSAISETYYEAVRDNKIDVCGYPKIDVDKSGEISYNEFLTCLIDSKKILTVVGSGDHIFEAIYGLI